MAVSEGRLPLGFTEAAFAMPDSLPGSSPELLRFLTKQPTLDTLCSQVEQGASSLSNVYDEALKNGLAEIGSLDVLPDSEFKLQKYARPPG